MTEAPEHVVFFQSKVRIPFSALRPLAELHWQGRTKTVHYVLRAPTSGQLQKRLNAALCQPNLSKGEAPTKQGAFNWRPFTRPFWKRTKDRNHES